jgi:hypothetical protein
MRHVEGKGGKGRVIILLTRVAHRSLPREYHGPALLLYPNGVTRAVRLEFTSQLIKSFPRNSQSS